MVNIKEGDYGFDLDFVITDADSARVDLSGGSVVFKMEKADIGSPVISGNCVIDTAISGTCHFSVGSGQTTTPGTYKWELETIFPGKVITTERTENIVIKEGID